MRELRQRRALIASLPALPQKTLDLAFDWQPPRAPNAFHRLDAQAARVFDPVEQRQRVTQGTRVAQVRFASDHFHRAAGAAQNIDGRKSPGVRKRDRKRDVSIQERARRFANRIAIVAVTQDGGDQS